MLEHLEEPTSGYKLLVFGGHERYHGDYDLIRSSLDQVHERFRNIGLLIHGDAPGADRLAGAWAMSKKIQVCTFPANWDWLGKPAGPRRNSNMLFWGQPEIAVAFPGGSGTADMTKKCHAAGVALIKFTKDQFNEQSFPA